MWPFKKKQSLEKIKREDVIDNICELEKQQNAEIQKMTERTQEVEKYLELGKKSKDRNLQLAYAKKINMLKEENNMAVRRVQYINANLKALNRLKIAIDDKGFLTNNSNMPINVLLSNPKELNKFLGGVNDIKMKNEKNLTNVLDTFDEFDQVYEGDDMIYGTSNEDDQLLSMFEVQQSEDDASLFESNVNSSSRDMNANS